MRWLFPLTDTMRAGIQYICCTWPDAAHLQSHNARSHLCPIQAYMKTTHLRGHFLNRKAVRPKMNHLLSSLSFEPLIILVFYVRQRQNGKAWKWKRHHKSSPCNYMSSLLKLHVRTKGIQLASTHLKAP